MSEAILQGLVAIADLHFLVMLLFGVVLGIVVGIIPGVGGTFGFAILLPFVWRLGTTEVIAVLIGICAVTQTSDTITSVLLGIPGTGGSVATIVDGHPMARKGEAGRAMSAAFISSAIGGLVGAVILSVSIPFFRIITSYLGYGEFFMLTLLGVGMVSVLTGPRPLKGLIAGILGLLLSSVGPAQLTYHFRFEFVLYLRDGISLVLVALGVFGLAEVFDFMIQGKPIASDESPSKGLLTGIRDVLSNLPLVLRSAGIGAYIGFIPGMGPAVANWLGYAHAIQTAKTKTDFGKGNVLGVIGPEAANNACRGGELIPTLSLGIPGSGVMALFMFALWVHGVFPGPEMLTKQVSLVYLIVFSLALANIVGAAICLILVKPLSKIANLPIHIVAPFILMILIMASFQVNREWGDLIALVVLGILGWAMKHFGFPRPPLIVGFVLGRIGEQYLGLALQRHGAMWMLRPGVIFLGLLVVISLVIGIRFQRKVLREERSLKRKDKPGDIR